VNGKRERVGDAVFLELGNTRVKKKLWLTLQYRDEREHVTSDWPVSDQEEELIRLLINDSDYAEV